MTGLESAELPKGCTPRARRGRNGTRPRPASRGPLPARTLSPEARKVRSFTIEIPPSWRDARGSAFNGGCWRMRRDTTAESGEHVADNASEASSEASKGGVLRGNVLWLSVVSFLNDAASEMIYPLLPLFLTGTLGAGAAFVGAVEGVAESASSLLKLVSGWMADRFGRRKALVAWGYGIAAVGRPLISVAGAAWQVLAIRLADRVGKGLRSAPRDAMLAESVPPERRGAAFGVHRAADHAGAVAGPLLASGLLLLLDGDLRTVFALALIPGLLTLAVVLWKVRDPRPSPASTDSAASASIPDASANSATSPDSAAPAESTASNRPPSTAAANPLADLRGLGPVLPRYLGVLALFTLGNASDAFLLLRARELGVAVALIPLLWGVLHVSKMVWSIIGGRLSDRVGPRAAIVAGWAVYAAVYAGFAVAGAAWHAWALFAVYGLFFGLTEAPEKALVAALAPQGRRGSAFGAYHFAIGIAALPASLLFGVVWETLGADTAFALGAALALAAALLLPLALPRGAARSV
jgi:MFS family permease